MADYMNPEAIRPQYDWKPRGFLAGQNYSQDRQRYEDVSSLQDYIMKNSAIESGAKLSDYFADAPVREAKRNSDIATSNATRETIGGIKRNELTKGSLDNELSSKTMASKIAEAAAKASMEGDKSGMSRLATGAAIARALGAAAGNGPGALAGVMQQLQQSKADPRIIQWFAQSRDVKELQAKAQMMTDAFMQANEHYRSTMDANKNTNETRIKEANIQAGSALAVAQERTKSKLKSIDQMMQDVLKLTPDKQVGFYDQVIADGDATLKQKRDATVARDAAIKAMNLSAPKVDAPIKDANGNVILEGSSQRRYGEGPGDRASDLPPGVVRVD